MDQERVDLRHFRALVEASGLSLTDDEVAALAKKRTRAERQRAALSDVELGEAEPAVVMGAAST